MDYGFIESNLEKIKRSLAKRNSDFDLAEIERLAGERKKLQLNYDTTKAELNGLSKQIGELMQKKADPKLVDEVKSKTVSLKEQIQNYSDNFERLDAQIKDKILYLPNYLHDSVVEGKSAIDNPIVRVVGDPKVFSFKAKTHDELGEAHGILDFDRAAKVTGARFSFLRNWGAQLERALVQFMLDTHRERGYEELSVPYLVNAASMTGTGQLPKFAEDAFALKDPEYYLIPTAEVPVTNFFQNETLSESMLPKGFVAYSPCFRREAGSYGKDTKGLVRQHQFHKVELMIFAPPEKSYELHEKLTNDAEEILKRLELPYRVAALCSGDIGVASAKTYDIEVWLPGQNTYREISSCSNFEDFQARRANIRFKGTEGKPRYVHTLNGSGLAVGRTLLALLENGQQADGKIQLPKALAPYMSGKLSY